jgi:hypothetical protein
MDAEYKAPHDRMMVQINAGFDRVLERLNAVCHDLGITEEDTLRAREPIVKRRSAP